jgi:hypothetical protein
MFPFKKDWWLMPVIFVTQKAEIRRIAVQSPAQENSSQDPMSKTHHTKGLVVWLKV